VGYVSSLEGTVDGSEISYMSGGARFLPSTVWIPVPYSTEPGCELIGYAKRGNSKTSTAGSKRGAPYQRRLKNRKKKTCFLSYVPDIQSSTRDSEDSKIYGIDHE